MGAHAGGGGGGGFTAVGCVLACDAPFTIHDVGAHDILWDALYDNLWDLDPLASIPDGLGLTFAFDGSASLIVPTEAGIWTFSYSAERLADTAWVGSIVAMGLNYSWVQQLTTLAATAGTPHLTASFAMPLPAGTQITNQIVTETAANAGAYTCTQVWLSIVRHK